MCLRKLFGKKEVVEEVPVERRSVDELMNMINDLAVQLSLVLNDANEQEARIQLLEEELQKEREQTMLAKDQVVDLLNKQAELERKLFTVYYFIYIS